jgi:hypothetical protein
MVRASRPSVARKTSFHAGMPGAEWLATRVVPSSRAMTACLGNTPPLRRLSAVKSGRSRHDQVGHRTVAAT